MAKNLTKREVVDEEKEWAGYRTLENTCVTVAVAEEWLRTYGGGEGIGTGLDEVYSGEEGSGVTAGVIDDGGKVGRFGVSLCKQRGVICRLHGGQ